MEIGKRSTDYASIYANAGDICTTHSAISCQQSIHATQMHSCSELLIASNGLWQMFAVQF